MMKFAYNELSGTYEGFCVLKSVESKVTAKGMPYLDMILSDASGEISAKYWDYNPAAADPYLAGEIIKVRGTISQYNGADQFRVERIRHANETDTYRMEDLVKAAEYDAQAMFEELKNAALDMEDMHMKKLVLYLLEKNREKLLFWPAAFKLHHAIRGGLLYHTLSILRLAQSVCTVYPHINKDLLVAGAILHDMAKLDEFQVNDTGIATGYSVEGNLIGHLAKGAILIDRAAKELGVPEEIAILLEHMVLSHHSEPEYGAAVRPMLLESEVLAELDLMDARIYEMSEAISATEVGDFTGRMWALDNRKLFNHGMMPCEPKANIL
ncbi:MAG: HD domain-containing protein [Clostridia bacterium]|nr:HD domain-containing protein [Clostridia bacterium]